MNTRYKSFGAIAVLTLATFSAGCMTSPYNGEHLGGFREPFTATGYLAEPGQQIDVQALSKTGEWVTIGTAVSTESPRYWEGSQSNWYAWQANGLQIPYICWELDGYYGRLYAELRAVYHGSEDSVFTFNDLFLDPSGRCFAADKTLSEVWNDCGNHERNEITVYADWR